MSRALSLIAQGAFDEGGVEALADRLGVGARHLRRLFDRYVGATPVSVVQAQRILLAATDRFAFNIHGAEMAQLAANVYRPKPGEPPKPTPTGWKNISSDPNRLKTLGLEQSDLHVPRSNYRAQVYEPDPTVFGDDMKTTIAFKGTDPGSGEDWKNNLDQGLDNDSLYYRQSVGVGKNVNKRGADVEITGHSLGGGLPSGASRASGAPATNGARTFSLCSRATRTSACSSGSRRRGMRSGLGSRREQAALEPLLRDGRSQHVAQQLCASRGVQRASAGGGVQREAVERSAQRLVVPEHRS